MKRRGGGEQGRGSAGTHLTWALILALQAGLSMAPTDAHAQRYGHLEVHRHPATVHNGNSPDGSNEQGGPVDGNSDGAKLQQTAGAWRPYGRMYYGRGNQGTYIDPSGAYSFSGAHGPLWSGAIEEGFQQMRRTSPFPNRFAGGAYNPRSFVDGFGGFPTYYSYPSFGNFFYGGYSLGLRSHRRGSLYFGFVPSVYSFYGSWYPPYLPLEHVYIIEHERVIEPRDSDAGPRERREEAELPERSGGAEGEYYLSPPARPSGSAPEKGEPKGAKSLDDAVAAIRSAWLNGDHARLLSRIGNKGRVRIYLKGKYKYSVDAPDFGQMTRDAMSRIDTISFTLDKVQRQGDDRAFVSGKHVYNDPDHEKHEVYVSYGLVKEDGRWKIVEAGSSTEPVSAHGD